MPIYEYECRACGNQLEMFQKITEEPLKLCPQCGQDALQKLISSTSFQLKGTGWYVTDIRDKGKPKPAGEQEGGKQDSEQDTSVKDSGDVANSKTDSSEKSEKKANETKLSSDKGKGEGANSSSKSEAK